ncbi:aldehyde dehydrogenase family protein [Streptomyces cellulosae]
MTTIARHWINGRWAGSGSVLESINPADGTVVGSFYDGGEAEASAAVDAAAAAFETTEWARTPSLRSTALSRLADALEARIPEVAAMLSRENGKLLSETTWEVSGAVGWLRYAAASARTQNAGRAAETAPGQYTHSVPEPLGVAGIIPPWNSPVMQTVRALGPALAAGCTVVVKLPAQTALTNELFAQVRGDQERGPGVAGLGEHADHARRDLRDRGQAERGHGHGDDIGCPGHGPVLRGGARAAGRRAVALRGRPGSPGVRRSASPARTQP